MRRWSIGINNYYFTGSIYLEEAPWYIFSLEDFIMKVCDIIPRMPLPNIKIKIDGEEWTMKSYYGTFRDLFHVFICSKITIWCFSKIKTNEFKFPYFKLKEKYPEFFIENDYKDEDKELKENEKISKNIEKEFDKIYEKLN